MAFRINAPTAILLEGKTATGIPDPTSVVEHRAAEAATGPITIGGPPNRISVAAYGDVFTLPLSADEP